MFKNSTEEWKHYSDNNNGDLTITASFSGKPTPTDGVLKVLGESGVQNIDERIKKERAYREISCVQTFWRGNEMLYCADFPDSELEGYIIEIVGRTEQITRESTLTRKMIGCL